MNNRGSSTFETVATLIGSVVVIILVVLVVIFSGGLDKKEEEPTLEERFQAANEAYYASQNESSSYDNSYSSNSEEKTNSEDNQYAIASDTTNMSKRQICKDSSLYVSLLDVRSLNYLQTAIPDYTEEIGEDEEALYAIYEVYNYSDKVVGLSHYGYFSAYADSISVPDDTGTYLEAIDGFCQYNGYYVDPGKKCIIVTTYVVKKGWSEMKFFYEDFAWTIRPEDVNYDTFVYDSVFSVPLSNSITPDGKVIYSGDTEVVFDGFEIYHETLYGMNNYYAMFKFTVTNNTSETIDYGSYAYYMRGYKDNIYIDHSIRCDSINGYEDIYSVQDIKPGMSVKLYVAFDIPSDESGQYECIYDSQLYDDTILGDIVVNY